LLFLILVKELCDAIEQYDQLVALRLEGNTINEAAATAIGQALEKHSEIQVLIFIFDNQFFIFYCISAINLE
jgi:Ran GTPase-activating protein (RanGAP) involved in mRNA processing and transport